MAKFTAIAVVFCLFAAALALNPPENDDATTVVALPFSDEVNPMIRLPTDDSVKSENSGAAKDTETVATTMIEHSFRPINRRFSVRRSKHACRHHLVDPTVRGRVEIPYGNDMVISSGENGPEVIHGGGRKRVRLHHHHHHKDDDTDSDSDSDSDDDDDDDDDDHHGIEKIVYKRHDHRSDRKKLKELKKMRESFRIQNEKKEKQSSGFMNSVRKFFGHYF